jgi:hypothetical protein
MGRILIMGMLVGETREPVLRTWMSWEEVLVMVRLAQVAQEVLRGEDIESMKTLTR